MAEYAALLRGTMAEGAARVGAEAEEKGEDLQSICFTSLIYSHELC